MSSENDSKKTQNSGKPASPEKPESPIQYGSLEVVHGPLHDFNSKRRRILKTVVGRTLREYDAKSLEIPLGQALYQERIRIRKARSSIFTVSRNSNDRLLWRGVQRGLLKPSTEVARRKLLEKILRHYGNEIGCRFRPSVYDFATNAIPFMFNWLLHAASLKNFRPWGLSRRLGERLEIAGDIQHVVDLSKKGTILLTPTHQSNIDSVLIGYIIYLMGLPPFSYGAGLNLFSNPVLSFFMGSLGAYTVDRGKTNAIYKTILKNYSTVILKQGIHSIFFPGGGRSRSGAIESHLKLGLLGTALQAQIENYQESKKNPNIYVVPMVTSYDFVLEASSLIEQYLSDLGKHRFMGADTEENPKLAKLATYFWKFFSSKSRFSVRIGKPLDVFGNLVDEQGRSLGPNGTVVDPRKWVTSNRELKPDLQRDAEYTRELGERLVDRFYAENRVLSSHLVAFSFFMTLRRRYKELDLYRFLRLSQPQRSLSMEEFLKSAEETHRQVVKLANSGRLNMSEDLKSASTEAWIEKGVKYLGSFHEHAVIKIKEGVIWTEDMNLLYYYRNRLSGYGLSLYGTFGRAKLLRGETDEQGFLA